MADRRLIDIRESELRDIIHSEVASAIQLHATHAGRSNIVSGRKNIAKALGISVDKLDTMIEAGDLKGAVKKNGRTLICDIDRAFRQFDDVWNK